MFTDTTWFTNIINLFGDLANILQRPPFSYFIILALLAIVASVVRRFYK